MKNLKIRTQLLLGFAAMLFFVIILGIVSYMQTNEIHLQVETMFDHPLMVRRAIGSLETDILSMRLGTRDLMLAKNEKERQDAIQFMEVSAADAFLQFNVLKERYLGPAKDIDEALNAFMLWKSAREENTQLALLGANEKVKENVLSTGKIGHLREQMLVKIKAIDNFAIRKGEFLYAFSNDLHNSLNRQLILLVMAILLLSVIINFILLRNIRKPIIELTNAANRFHNGDMNARSAYGKKNEFGVLSDSFNSMVEQIQQNTDLDEKFASLANLMLSEYNVNKFFQTTLHALAQHTGSQMAAIYLLSDDKKTFEHFESIGLDNNAKQSFSVCNFEGEFGAVLSSRKIQHIKNITENSRFVFQTVSGTIIPQEIMSLPVLINNEVIAIISLASIGKYSKQSIQLIDKILTTLSARIEGVLAFQKITAFLEKLEIQNSELEAQKTELSSQSAELMEQNIELEMQKKQLREANHLKTNFLSNMSHELRTPLNSVIALSGVLTRRLASKIPEDEYSYIEVIQRNGKHLLELINDILDISRIEAGHEEIDITEFNVNNLIDDVVSMIQPQLHKKNVELLHPTVGADLFFSSDVRKCRHIIQNIIANAVKFTEKGKVEVTAELNGNNIQVKVSDTGIGIDETHIQHIFDEFRQADGSTSRKFGGTGLGLAIAKKYAMLLGGTIAVKSILGKGSEFTLSLPLQYAATKRIRETESTLAYKYEFKQTPFASDSVAKTILLVEDSEPAIIQMKDFMEESGYQILHANNGNEALRIIASTQPDAIILDLMMPGIDGFEVLRTLREAEPTAHVPVLILTAKHITKEELAFLKRNNIHQLIQKGDVNRNELLNAVKTMVFTDTNPRLKPEREFQNIEGDPLVLVVEDNPDNMITVKALLADNYKVIEAVNGQQALEMAMKYMPNLILMDIALPGMDGIAAFKTIRNNLHLHCIPVIALTASAMTSDRETILAFGFDAYIAKPIDEQTFFKMINETLYGQ